jgi:hypothetical protein
MVVLLAPVSHDVLEAHQNTVHLPSVAWSIVLEPRAIPSELCFHEYSGLEENVGMAGVVLTGDDLREIDRIASKITEHGGRYPEELERRTGRRVVSR